MVHSYEQFDRSYRRGVVLGLSLAEIFLILLFLLLLVFIGTTAALNEKRIQENQELADQLRIVHKLRANEITIEEFTRLAKDAGEKQRLERENQELTDQLRAIHKLKANEITIEEFTRLAKDAGGKQRLERKNQELTDQLRAVHKLRANATTFDDFAQLAKDAGEKQRLERENQELTDQLRAVHKLRANATTFDDFTQLAKEAGEKQRLERENQELAEALDSLSKQGQDPPCWFVEVLDSKEPDGRRQRHIEIFDVRISDNSFRVRIHNNSRITKPIDKGNESALPRFNNAIFNKELTADELFENFKTFYEAGENKKIRNYSCRFMVHVYDETSSDNKEGYKKNLEIVERLFYKFEGGSRWTVY